jgi:histidinol dehydrogenase
MEYAEANDIRSFRNHRNRAEGLLVYPVYSRRARGLSIGINLYPDKKCCNFDCKYCEVFPFSGSVRFSLETMKRGLREAIAAAVKRYTPIKDICFSGNGEPSLSSHFEEALLAVLEIRDEAALAVAPNVAPNVVVISNGAGLLRRDGFDFFKACSRPPYSVRFWIKLDAGSAGWYKKINDGVVDFEQLVSAIKEFSQESELVIQTMHCAVDGVPPSIEEMRSWAELVAEIAAPGNVKQAQIYGKSRQSFYDPLCTSLPLASLEERADILRAAFGEAGVKNTPVGVYE